MTDDQPVEGRIIDGLLALGRIATALWGATKLVDLAREHNRAVARHGSDDDRATGSAAIRIAEEAVVALLDDQARIVEEVARTAVAAGVTPSRYDEIVHEYCLGEEPDPALPVALVRASIESLTTGDQP